MYNPREVKELYNKTPTGETNFSTEYCKFPWKKSSDHTLYFTGMFFAINIFEVGALESGGSYYKNNIGNWGAGNLRLYPSGISGNSNEINEIMTNLNKHRVPYKIKTDLERKKDERSKLLKQ